MRAIGYILIQWTWGILQNLLGIIVFLINIKNKHYWYHGALITVWKSKSSVSIGMFVFITEEPFFYEKLKGTYVYIVNRSCPIDYWCTNTDTLFNRSYWVRCIL